MMKYRDEKPSIDDKPDELMKEDSRAASQRTGGWRSSLFEAWRRHKYFSLVRVVSRTGEGMRRLREVRDESQTRSEYAGVLVIFSVRSYNFFTEVPEVF
jgi:hypothetical protein